MHPTGGKRFRFDRRLLALVLIAALWFARAPTVAGTILPPAVVSAQPASHQITLAWQGVAGASQYRVYRSYQAGKDYERIAEVPASGPVMLYTDASLINQVMHFYVVTTLDGAGIESAYSPEAAAMPNPQIEYVRPLQPASINYPTGGDAPVLVTANFRLDDPGVPLEPAPWLMSQLRLGAASQPPAAWTQVIPARIKAPAGVTLLPEAQAVVYPAAGDAAYLICFSVDGGRTWKYYGPQGIIAHPDQTQLPAALGAITFTATVPGALPEQPAAPTISAASASEITLAWPPSTAQVMVDIYRAGAPDAEPLLVGRVPASALAFTDGPLKPHAAYFYTLRAYDPGFHYSAPSAPLAALTPDADPLQVTLRVRVPPVPQGEVYINRLVDAHHLAAGADWRAQRLACDWNALTCSLNLSLQSGSLFPFIISRGNPDTVATLPDGNTPAPDPSFVVPRQAYAALVERSVSQWEDPLVVAYHPTGPAADARQPIRVVWNQVMPPATAMTVEAVRGSIPAPVPGQSILAADRRTLVFSPDQPLTPGITYRVSIQGQMDINLHPQQAPFGWEFTPVCCRAHLPVIAR